MTHYASLQRAGGQRLIEQLRVDGELDAERASSSYVQLDNHTPQHHARVEEVGQRADLL